MKKIKNVERAEGMKPDARNPSRKALDNE